jgi:N-acetylneuraminate synthase
MRTIEIGDRKIGEGEPTFIIAEAGSNHNGNLEQAKKLIDVASDAGANAIKFQLFKSEMMYPTNSGVVETPMGDVDIFEILKKMEIPYEWLKILKEYSENKGLIFLCSGFDEESIEVLENIGISAHKIASPELNHIPLLEYLQTKNKPIIMSTGLSMLCEIEEAINTCCNQGDGQAILLHCVSAYPTPLEDCNLNVIKTLKMAFDVPVGFSDHTLDPVIAPAVAVAINANVIEKHFTLSRDLEGPDHSFALEPSELKQMVDEIRKIDKVADKISYVKKLIGSDKLDTVLGGYKKTITSSELDIYPNDKRSIHAISDICKGEVLNIDNMRVLRSERNLNPGIHPRYYKAILGKKITRDVAYGSGITWDDLLDGGGIGNGSKNTSC